MIPSSLSPTLLLILSPVVPRRGLFAMSSSSRSPSRHAGLTSTHALRLVVAFLFVLFLLFFSPSFSSFFFIFFLVFVVLHCASLCPLSHLLVLPHPPASRLSSSQGSQSPRIRFEFLFGCLFCWACSCSFASGFFPSSSSTSFPLLLPLLRPVNCALLIRTFALQH